MHISAHRRLLLLGACAALLSAGVAAPSAGDVEDCTIWTMRSGSGPAPRVNHCMAFDADRGVSVLFGGTLDPDGHARSSETWEWDGASWRLVGTDGPDPAQDPSMCYDSVRRQVLLYRGGDSGGTPFGETWSWDGKAWTLWSREPLGPAGGHTSLAFDKARGVAVLVVPRGDLPFAVWEWDGDSWALAGADGPLSRTGHAVAFDEVRATTVLFGGGVIKSGFKDDQAYEWNGSAWAHLAGADFGAPADPALVFDPARRGLVLFDGYGLGLLRDAAWTPLYACSLPPARKGHAAVMDIRRGRLVLFGGILDATMGDDTWELSASAGDCTHDCRWDINDFICFQAEWRKRSAYGDFDGSGVWNINDFIAFQAAWRKGCSG